MNSVMISVMVLMGGNPGGDGQSPSNPLLSFLPFILIIVVLYFLMIRPQKKRQKDREKLIAGVNKGDKVITVGGVHGTIQATKDKTVILKIADNVKIEIERSAISTVILSSDASSQDVQLLEPDNK